MNIIHTSRTGKRYYLHLRPRKDGKPNYFFSTDPEGPMADTIPAGYEVYESIAGQVFLRRKTAQVISEEELDRVRQALSTHAEGWRYKAEIKKNMIVVHEADQDITWIECLAPRLGPASLREAVIKTAHYMAVLRFILVDQANRQFAVQRYCFRGSVDRWISIGEDSPSELSTLVKKYVRHLGKDSFYDLM